MKINYVSQSEEIPNVHIDYFICASGFESRSGYFFKKNKYNFKETQKVCFLFSDRKELSWKENYDFFHENKFSFIDVNSNSVDNFILIFDKLFKSTKKNSINVVVDFSSMNTIIYAALLKYFFSTHNSFIEASIFFNYTIALFTEPSASESLVHNHPISIFDTLQTTDKKITLIIGLGLEKNKALGLYQFFDNDKNDIYLFITKNKKGNDYFETVMKNNEELIKFINPENIIYYDLNNVTHLISTLDSLVNYLINSDSRVVLAPIGPKQFTLASLLINLFHNEVTTFRFSHGNKAIPKDRKADTREKSIITHLNFKID